MNETKTIYAHESDVIIMGKKDKSEVVTWTDNLTYINDELEYLLNIEDAMLHVFELNRQLLLLRRENTLRLASLNRYENTLKKAIECDTLACDAYYLHHHKKNRNAYLEHLKQYRNLKTQVLAKILSKVNQ